MENIFMQMVRNIEVNEKLINKKGKEWKDGRMGQNMRGIIRKGRRMGKVLYILLMGVYIQGISYLIILMDMECIHGQIKELIKVNGKIIK